MAIEESARVELYRKLEEVLGSGPAATLMEQLPPHHWANLASKDDLRHENALLRSEMAEFKTELRGEFAELRAALRGEMAEFKAQISGELAATKNEILATVRGEMIGAIQAQTRSLLLGLVGAVGTVSALAYGIAGLS